MTWCSCADRFSDLAARHEDHLDPRLLVVDRARGHNCQVLVTFGHRADVVQRLFVGLAGEHFPDGLIGAAHTTIPSRRMVSRASARMRSFVQIGSHTTSM